MSKDSDVARKLATRAQKKAAQIRQEKAEEEERQRQLEERRQEALNIAEQKRRERILRREEHDAKILFKNHIPLVKHAIFDRANQGETSLGTVLDLTRMPFLQPTFFNIPYFSSTPFEKLSSRVLLLAQEHLREYLSEEGFKVLSLEYVKKGYYDDFHKLKIALHWEETASAMFENSDFRKSDFNKDD